MERMCSRCHQVKDESDFRVQKQKRGGKIYLNFRPCKECEKAYNHDYYLKYTKQRRKEKKSQWSV